MEYAKLAEVWRGPVVESVHFGAAAVANAAGEVLHGWGDPSVVTFPRSSLKPIQTIALVETGAAEKFGLTQRQIALASASHRAEDIHVDLVMEWLAQLDLTEAALACGPDLPRDSERAHAIIRSGGDKSRRYHNCSGKHCGFLTVARHMGWPVEGYNEPSHPTQTLYLEVLSEFLGRDAASLPMGVDGCTLPAPAMSIADMAAVMARYAAASVASPANGSTPSGGASSCPARRDIARTWCPRCAAAATVCAPMPALPPITSIFIASRSCSPSPEE